MGPQNGGHYSEVVVSSGLAVCICKGDQLTSYCHHYLMPFSNVYLHVVNDKV